MYFVKVIITQAFDSPRLHQNYFYKLRGRFGFDYVSWDTFTTNDNYAYQIAA